MKGTRESEAGSIRRVENDARIGLPHGREDLEEAIRTKAPERQKRNLRHNQTGRSMFTPIASLAGFQTLTPLPVWPSRLLDLIGIP